MWNVKRFYGLIQIDHQTNPYLFFFYTKPMGTAQQLQKKEAGEAEETTSA